jgi:L-fuconolactonase
MTSESLLRSADCDADQELPLDAHLAIIDSHHHLRDVRGPAYLAREFAADIAASGHRIVASVAVETGYAYEGALGKSFAPTGETRFLADVGATPVPHDSGVTRIAAAIVGYADLRLGDDVRGVLEAHIEAGKGRFKGVRTPAAWHAYPRFKYARAEVARQALEDPGFRSGFAHLAALQLSYDAWVYDEQLADVMHLADAFNGVRIIVGHCGGPVSHAGPLTACPEAFKQWQDRIQRLAKRPNVLMKLGGLGLEVMGLGFDARSVQASSELLAEAWRPYIETCISAFGAERCMFESNFPPDSTSCRYGHAWNAFKRITAGYAAGERDQLFSETARQAYAVVL